MEKIVKTLFVVASVTLSMGPFVSCKDYNEDLRTELKSDISKQASLQDALQTQLNSLKSTLEGIKSCQCDLTKYLTKQEAASTYLTQASIQAYLDQVAANKAAIEMLQSAIDAINAQLAGLGDKSIAEQLNEVNVTILNVSSIANEALELAKNAGKCECNLDELKQQIATLEGLVAGWDEKLTEVNKKAADAMAKAEENATWIEKNKETIEALKKLIEDNKVLERLATIESSYMKKDDITALVNEAKEAAKAANDLAKKAMAQAESNSGKIGELEETVKKIGELEEAVKTLVSTEEFQTEIAKLDTAILGLAVIVEAIDAELVKVKADFTSMITGIIAQTTLNPVLGYINIPFDVNQYLLAAYYGQADNGMEFPARDGKYYLDASDVDTWTPRNLEVMGVSSLKNVDGYFTQQNERFVAAGEGNAGKIYVTINPSNVNFTGQVLDLETSTQNSSPIAIGALEPSNEELDFGIYRTRSVENGFYEAKATLKVEDIDKVKVTVDLQGISEAVKEVMNKPSTSTLADASAKILRGIQNNVPAYGLKASWTDQSNGQVHNIYSQYNIATIAVKPLSFAFMKDKTFNHVKGFDRIRSAVNNFIKEVKIKLPNMMDYKIEFTSIRLGEDITVDENGKILVPITAIVNSNGEKVEVVIDELYGDMTEFIVELVNEINERYGEGSDVDEKLADFFNLVEETNNFQTYLDETKSDLYSSIEKYINRIENAILKVANKAHKSLYIAMFGSQKNDIALLSTDLNVPTKAKAGELDLIPTTYTLQYFAPIYKKFVAVTNVYDAKTKAELDLASAKSAAAAANGGKNMLKVVDGLENCSFNGETGKIYELTYTAVDYLGVVMIRKYYVEF